jgi:hypothetical protein
MKDQALRLLIRAKLADGRLPHDSIPRVWGGPGNNESCDACEETISKEQLVMEGVGSKGGGVQFHVRCFHLWDSERQAPGHASSDTGEPHG